MPATLAIGVHADGAGRPSVGFYIASRAAIPLNRRSSPRFIAGQIVSFADGGRSAPGTVVAPFSGRSEIPAARVYALAPKIEFREAVAFLFKRLVIRFF